ncbi:MAG: (d)CMP kinase [Flavobacteriales bacterium]
MTKKITIAIDGYAACGKSTLAKALAQALNYTFIDSGAMYRAVAFYCLEKQCVDNQGVIQKEQLEKFLSEIEIEMTPDQRIFLNKQDITDAIRTPRVANVVSQVATIKSVRSKLVELQQAMGKNGGIVMDGRDIGTVVFPDAELKIFVTASTEVRTARRLAELNGKGAHVAADEVTKNLLERDHLDSTRAESPLKQAANAIVLDTTYLSREEQLQWALERVRLLVTN